VTDRVTAGTDTHGSAGAGAPGGSDDGAGAPAPPRFKNDTFGRWFRAPEASVVFVIVFLLIFVVFRGKFGIFFSEFNRDSMTRSVSLQSIFSVGELLVILTGGIDLSIGSLVAFSGMLLAVVAGRLADSGMNPQTATLIAILAVVAASLLLGVIHATLVQLLRLPPFVVTLASMSMLRSGAMILNNAVPLPIERFPLITFLGNKKVFIAGTGFGLPVSTVILIVVAGLIGLALLRTQVGRGVYAVGSNEEASRLSGVNVYAIRLFVYCLCSLLGGLAGILYAGYSAQGDPNAGNMFELNAISAVVIGGAILTGGRGSVAGTILGALLLEMILNLINLSIIDLGVINPALSNSTLSRGMVVGGVLLLAVVVNQVRQVGWLRKTSRVIAK
jgi:ribose/xylose/arabinose/galactoside ABC-type transport system permease subunit